MHWSQHIKTLCAHRVSTLPWKTPFSFTARQWADFFGSPVGPLNGVLSTLLQGSNRVEQTQRSLTPVFALSYPIKREKSGIYISWQSGNKTRRRIVPPRRPQTLAEQRGPNTDCCHQDQTHLFAPRSGQGPWWACFFIVCQAKHHEVF